MTEAARLHGKPSPLTHNLLALAYAALGQRQKAVEAAAQAKPVKDAPWEDVYLQRLLEAEVLTVINSTVDSSPLPDTLKRVVQELKERNPEFNGKVTYKLENNVVTELQFVTDNVTDLSPLRALTALQKLSCYGSKEGAGKLADLSPLQGLPLTELRCFDTAVADLSPLKGMPLTFLFCYRTRVNDLTPLQGMKLTTLACWGTPVSELTPLQGMPLTFLSCSFTKVSDLTPLADMKLATLFCQNAKVTDLSPLRGMPLTNLSCDFVPARDTEILRSIRSLETLNGVPAKTKLGK